ncbi:hypothetical protein SAMN05660284_01529 [Formivibrio citricus]|uniref:Hydrolase or metal-binding protein n=1 Tax=Formivibrio citricus TaxID=83765 RepID=A0A1I4Z5Q2_9NEIS|nr:hypothetical protein [Formivibrio citricus]SFN45319.1 hypothetical protein SAMN05660284_01529 [Formivibrio citricus]
MIKGLAITPPVIGRISIGRVVERNGKRLPEKDDCFTITSQVQGRDGWMLHPLHNHYAEATDNKLRAIPVRLLFNDTDLNLRAEYSVFDRQTGRPVCVGNGQTAKRSEDTGVSELECPGPQGCAFGQKAGCKLYGRLNVQIDGQEDELGSFIFRTTGYNSVRTLAARLRYFEAASGGNTKHLPLMLKLRAKSTTQSHRAPVFYVDLTLRNSDTLASAVKFARDEAQQQAEAGVETDRLEDAARLALANGVFEDSEEEAPAIVEEFFPETQEATSSPSGIQETQNHGADLPVSSPATGSPHVRQNRVTPRLGRHATGGAP